MLYDILDQYKSRSGVATSDLNSKPEIDLKQAKELQINHQGWTKKEIA